jgi:AAA+ superfamily predicted ATPase
MEEYEGISILATNLRKNLDEAFARRMHFSIEFPLPEEPDRLSIWRGVFPEEAPLSDNVDLKFMARQFKVSGGNIKNIAFAAAFLSASDGGTIRIEHLIRATRREYQKLGRLCTESDFGPYFDLVKGEQEVA